jgi:ssDNA-binding replication factor A large subunit
MGNYEQLVEKIAESAKLSVDDILRKIEAKKAKLSGLVSKEGAAQIVAAELGINFDKEKMQLSQIVHGMKRVNVIGKVLEIYPVREFNKNGKEGKVASFLMADESGSARIVMWDTNHIALVEKGEIKKDSVLEINNGSARNGELHLSSFSDIKKSNEKMENVAQTIPFGEKNLADAKAGESIKTRAVIVQIFEPRYFEVCDECGKKVEEGKCKVHGDVTPKKRALLSVVIDDGSETFRSVLFYEQLIQLGLTEEEIFSLEKFGAKKENLLGEEMMFSGRIRTNELYNTTELMIDNVRKIDADELMKELEAKA